MQAKCECFGDSGIHASTHVPVGSDKEHCDLCGYPVQDGSVDALTAINSDPPDDKLGKSERMLDLLYRNLAAWEDEEDSVKEEHEDLITDLRNFLDEEG